MLVRPLRLAIVAFALVVGGATACGGMDTPQRPASATIDSTGTPAAADNPFIPEDRNFGDCVSSLPRPGCGSTAHGGAGQAITLVVLLVGMALIGWRIAHSVRTREREHDPVDGSAGSADSAATAPPGRSTSTG